MTKLVSIVIPSYNRGDLIGETLDSIIAQTYLNWECLIIDDGSTDSTKFVVEEYVKKDQRFKYHIRPKSKPKGANACRNYGFELSKGVFINWFDSDDLMHKDKLRLQVEALTNSDFSFSVCQTLVFEGTVDNILGLRHESIYSENVFEDFVTKKIIWLTQAPLWRKQFLLENSFLFDEELHAAQEWEFHSKILNTYNNYHVIETPLVYFRKHTNSITNDGNGFKRRWNYYLARKKIFDLVHIQNNVTINNFLSDFFLESYKFFLINRKASASFSILSNAILFNNSFKFIYKLKMIVVYFSLILFKKGVFLFNGNYLKFS